MAFVLSAMMQAQISNSSRKLMPSELRLQPKTSTPIQLEQGWPCGPYFRMVGVAPQPSGRYLLAIPPPAVDWTYYPLVVK